MKDKYRTLEYRRQVYLSDRPLWGPHSFIWSEKTISTLLAKIFGKALQMYQDGGGLISIQGTSLQEGLMLVAIRALGGKLRAEDKKVIHIWGNLGEDFSAFSGFILIEDAPRIETFPTSLLDSPRGSVIIATGLKGDWEQIKPLPINTYEYLLPSESEDLEKVQKEYLYEQCVSDMAVYNLVEDEAVKEAYKYVLLFDYSKVAIPNELLAALVSNRDILDLVESSKGLFFEVKGRASVCAAGEFISERMLRWMAEEERKSFKNKFVEMLDDILEVISQASLMVGRKALRRLLYGLVLKHKSLFAREIVGSRWENRFRPIILQEGDPRELLAWGKLLGDIRLFEEGKEIFEIALQKDPQNIYLLHAYGKMLGEWAIWGDDKARKQRYDEAVNQFRKALEVELEDEDRKKARDTYIYQTLGDIAAKLGEYREAGLYFEKAHSIEPKNLHTLIAWGDSLIKQKRYSKAKEKIDKALALDGESLYAHHLLGFWHLCQWQHREAEEELKWVLTKDPENLPALHSMGILALQRGHLTEAEGYLHRALRFNSENVDVLNSLGNLYIEMGNYEKSEEQFENGLKLEKNNRFLLVSRVKMLIKKGELQGAERALKEVKKITENIYVRTMEGQLLMEEGRFDEAEEWLSDIIANEEALGIPPSAAILNLLGGVLAKQGRLEEACQAFEKAKSQEPWNQQTYCSWADVEVEAKCNEKAEELLNEALRIDKENAYIWKSYGSLWKARGDMSKAKEYFEKARELGLVTSEVLKELD